jgi:hypothetical protein
VSSALKIAVASGAALVLLAACQTEVPQPNPTVAKLSPDELKVLVESEPNLFFLDVRSPQEIIERGTLPGYVNIPIDQLEQRVTEIPRDRVIVTA